jgi:cell division protein FtsL
MIILTIRQKKSRYPLKRHKKLRKEYRNQLENAEKTIETRVENIIRDAL